MDAEGDMTCVIRQYQEEEVVRPAVRKNMFVILFCLGKITPAELVEN